MLIHTYKEKWIEDFNKIKNIIDETLSNKNITIEHIGSTSIPQLAAKPIIDIDIVYPSKVAFDEIKKRLAKIGYYHNGNQGILHREAFKRDGATRKHEILDAITHHLYVCPMDSEELERHILFRDYLIINEEAKNQYQNLKYEIANEVKQDKKKYAQLKEVKARDFINSIIEKAKRNKSVR